MKWLNSYEIRFVLVRVVIIGLLSMTSTSYAAEGTWTRKADMPTARFGLSTSVVDGKIYAIGGGKTPYGTYLSIVEEYEPAMDTWTTKADMPTARAFQSASVVNGKIYAIGGSPGAETDTPTVEEYDPATDTWTRKADMPTARTWLSSSVVDGKIYAIGGRIYPEEFNVSIVEEYDPVTDTWTRKADMPTPSSLLSTCVVNGKIYAIGGYAGSGYGTDLAIMEEYDPVTDTWTRKTEMPTARRGLSTCVLYGRIYAIGGGPYKVSATVEEYDPETDTWSKKADMSTARSLLSSSVVDGKIYTIGGSVVWWPWSPTSTVEEYDTGLTASQPDFNGDGTVDIKDLLRLIQSWGQDDPMVDIAPPPFGDGIIDAMDLELLMSYWEQPVDDPTLIAHWALDEAEGNIAADSAGDNDAFVVGGASWQPVGGMIEGALEFDGTDDYISASNVLENSPDFFSVFAWVKGGAPGQVIFSQANRSDWLSADATDGSLMTELRFLGKPSQPLQSQAVITDSQWHRVGLVWDGTNRILYVDDVEVASDTYGEGFISGDIQIGAGNKLETGTFWSGLIDDVHIYNRAVTP